MTEPVLLDSENTEACFSWSVGQVAWFDESGASTFLAVEFNGRYTLLLEQQAFEIIEALESGVAR